MKAKKIIQAMVILMVMPLMVPIASALESEKIYFIELEYNKGLLKLTDIDVVTGYPVLSENPALPYKLELMDVDSEVLYVGYFDVPKRIYGPPPLNPEDIASVVELDYVKFTISLPYHKRGVLIKIARDAEELYINAMRFAMYCGDTVCQPDENNKACPLDCLAVHEGKEEWAGKLPYLTLAIAIGILALILIKVRIRAEKRHTKGMHHKRIESKRAMPEKKSRRHKTHK